MLTQASRLFIVFVMLLGFAQIQAQDIPKGIMPNKRQVVGTGNSSPPNSGPPTTNRNQQTDSDPPPDSTPPVNSPTGPPPDSSTDVVRSTTIPTTIRVTTTDSDGSKVTTDVQTKTVAKTTKAVKNSFVTAKGTTVNAATITKQTVISEALVGSKTVKTTYTSYYTSNGRRQSTVITTNVVVPTTTGYSKTTIAPSLANGGGSGSGLSGNTKAVIGGVVGGIGGAAMIGGVAFVLWRLYNKKKQEDEYASSYGDKYSSNRESNMTFGSEGYGSTYGGRVNAASNF